MIAIAISISLIRFHGRQRSVSSDGTESINSRGARSCAYKTVNYVTILETQNCHMRKSATGPVREDTEFCERLLHQEIQIPEGTMFDDEFFEDFFLFHVSFPCCFSASACDNVRYQSPVLILGFSIKPRTHWSFFLETLSSVNRTSSCT